MVDKFQDRAVRWVNRGNAWYIVGSVLIGWLTAHLATVDGVITQWKTLGYVTVTLAVALAVMGLLALASVAYRNFHRMQAIARYAPKWLPLAPLGPDRIEFVEFARIAKDDFGWTELNDGHAFDLAHGLQQAVSDEYLALWGRRSKDVSTRDHIDERPLVKVPANHFVDHAIDVTRWLSDENFDTCTFKWGQKSDDAYRDLYLDRGQALKWLKRNGLNWKGRYSKRSARSS